MAVRFHGRGAAFAQEALSIFLGMRDDVVKVIDGSLESPFLEHLPRHLHVQDKTLLATALVLKEQARVLLLKNLGDGLVNGSKGVVLRFEYDHTHPMYLSLMYVMESGQLSEADFQKQMEIHNVEMFPIVEFDTGKPGQVEKVQQQIRREAWKIEQAGTTVATRTQVPLKLAWAIS